jgi:hypothetical protein
VGIPFDGADGAAKHGSLASAIFLIPRIGKKRVSEHPYLRFEGHFGRRLQNIHTYSIVPGDRASRSRLASRGARRWWGLHISSMLALSIVQMATAVERSHRAKPSVLPKHTPYTLQRFRGYGMPSVYASTKRCITMYVSLLFL